MININLSKILRYLLIILLNTLCIFSVQYYLNTQKDIVDSLSNLQATIFINSGSEKTNEEILNQLSNNKFSIVDVYDLQTKDKFLEIAPELENIINNDFMTFPKFVVVNNLLVNSLEEIEQLKNEMLQIEFVEDFVYDQKSYKIFLDNKYILNNYKDICYYCFMIICIIFVLKFIFYILKGFYREVFDEILWGFIIGLIAYALVCLIVPLLNQNQIFMLDWHILYIVVPLSFMSTLLTKESNA